MPSYYIDSNTGQRVEVKKTHRVRNFVVLPVLGFFAIIILVVAINGGGASTDPSSVTPASPSTGASPTPNSVAEGVSTVEVTGEGEAMVSIMAGGNSTNTVKLPHTAELPEGFAAVTVSRSPSVESYMQQKPDTAEISCRIIRGGEVVEEQKASGEFASVTCTKWR